MPAERHPPRPGQKARQRIAAEAARRMAGPGGMDLDRARREAARSLGVADRAALPSDREVEAALREHLALFGGRQPGRADPDALRAAALEAMDALAAFDPRLAGPLLSRLPPPDGVVTLHLHAEPPEAVAEFLHERGIPATPGARRVALDARSRMLADTWAFEAGGVAFELLVLPARALRQAPLGPDGAPVPRASAAALRRGGP